MTHFEAVLYGLVQGVTEYLPISSSAHLILLPKFLKTEDPGLVFDVFLHLGTLFATLIYFWRDWWALLDVRAFRSSVTGDFSAKKGMSIPMLVIATIPAVIVGYVLHDAIDSVFRGEGVIVTTLVVGGILLYGADQWALRSSTAGGRAGRTLSETTWKDALIVGLFQCLALVPGMSRSGSTMSGARLLGLTRDSAARFSFLMSAPITAGAILYELKKNGGELFSGPIPMSVLFVAFVSTFVFGMLSIGVLLRLLKRVGFLGFAIYRVLLAVTVYFMFCRH
jgi:undecaprenyl-diphosphatase